MESSCAAAGTHLTRRALLKLCIATATALAMPISLGLLMAEVLATRKRRPVIWLSCQECTGCTESLTRADAPTLERLLFELLSLDYHNRRERACGRTGAQDVPLWAPWTALALPWPGSVRNAVV